MRHLLVPLVGNSPGGSVVAGRTWLQTPLEAEVLGELAMTIVPTWAGLGNIGCVEEIQWTSQFTRRLPTALVVLALASAVVQKEVYDVAGGQVVLARGELLEESGGQVR